MADKNNKEKSDKGNGKKRGKSAISKKLDVLKKILKDGAKEHKDAIDTIILQYNDYKKLSKLENELEDLKARVEAAKIIKKNETERQKAEEAKKLKADIAKSKESK